MFGFSALYTWNILQQTFKFDTGIPISQFKTQTTQHLNVTDLNYAVLSVLFVFCHVRLLQLLTIFKHYFPFYLHSVILLLLCYHFYVPILLTRPVIMFIVSVYYPIYICALNINENGGLPSMIFQSSK